MNKDIEQALAGFRANDDRYEKPERYYNGDHDLAFATEKFQNTFGTLFREFALNLCPVVCDAVRDKLHVNGFSVETPGDGRFAGNAGPVDPLTLAARLVWARNRMERRAEEVHKEALRSGDAYVIVWPDESGRAAIYPNRARSTVIVYDEARPGVTLWAAKVWQSADKRWRLNLFYPDRIEKYASRSPAAAAPITDAAAFVDAEDGTVDNPYGVVPVFHFANNADLGQPGRSELEPAIPIQDGLNKSVLDMLVAMEFSAYRQRWAAGIELDVDATGKIIPPFQAGVDHVWLSESENAKFGDFEGADLTQFLAVKDSFRVDIASVTGTPLSYFVQSSGDLPSGESQRKSESRFIAKVRNRQTVFGEAWADALSLALAIDGVATGAGLVTLWQDPAPIGDAELLQNILLKKQIGLDTARALLEAGYGAASSEQ